MPSILTNLTQVCLVSDQAIQNITPVLEMGLRPKAVVLVASDTRMSSRAEGLALLLSKHGITPHVRPLSSAVNFKQMQDDFRRICSEFPDAMLNATGGKKTMSLAAYTAFTEAGRHVFYVEIDNSLQWLSGGDAEVSSIKTQLSLEDLLAAHRQSIYDFRPAGDLSRQAAAFASWLFMQGRQQSDHCATLQFEGEAERKLISAKQGPLNDAQVALLERAQEHGVVFKSGGHWCCNKQQASFLSGGWLEAHVSSIIQKTFPDVKVFQNVKVEAVGAPDLKNEMDVMFVRKNRLFLIECKALKVSSKSKNNAVLDFINKLESVRSNGGLSAKAALLVWGGSLSEANKERALYKSIQVFEGESLNQFQLAVQRWITGN